MKIKTKVEIMDHEEDSFETNLEVDTIFLTDCLVNIYHDFGCNEKRRLFCNKRSNVISLLRMRLVFLVSEPKKIAKSLKGHFYHSFSNYLSIVLVRIFRGSLAFF